MKIPLLLLAVAWLPFAALGQTQDTDCAVARDPDRCVARQAALKACADKRGTEKRACLDASLPPVDCAKASNPARCEAAQKAKDICKDKRGKALKACLRDENPGKKKRRNRPPANPR